MKGAVIMCYHVLFLLPAMACAGIGIACHCVPSRAILCCHVLFRAILCYCVLFRAIPCYPVLSRAIPCYPVLSGANAVMMYVTFA